MSQPTVFDIQIQEDEGFDICLTTPTMTGTSDYNKLKNKPSINGVTLVGDISSEDLNLSSVPAGGSRGDLLAKRSDVHGDVEWITPASSVEEDNTRPITAAAVYTEIGNINALLAII